jgi:hypothetical protein
LVPLDLLVHQVPLDPQVLQVLQVLLLFKDPQVPLA